MITARPMLGAIDSRRIAMKSERLFHCLPRSLLQHVKIRKTRNSLINKVIKIRLIPFMMNTKC